MKQVLLVSSEPLRERMAGIGIRYVEMARALRAAGLKATLISPSGDLSGEEPPQPVAGVDCEVFDLTSLAEKLAGFDVVVAQGQLANDVVLAAPPDLPVVIDLYDPWLVENFHYKPSLGLDPYRNDHASWVLQMSSGDFFLCSSEEQRSFYLGFLLALGRVNPPRVEACPALDDLIAVAPFGQPAEMPPHRALLPPRRDGERRLLFGGLYEWYDPWPLLAALEQLDRPAWQLLVVSNPNPETPQQLLRQVEAWCRQRAGWWQQRVRLIDWVPFERRYDLLRDCDLLVATHRPSLETQLSMRTRFLDALSAQLPIVTTRGGTISRLLGERDAGWVLPEEDVDALVETLGRILDDPNAEEVRKRVQRGRALARELTWERALEPLVSFCRDPRVDTTKAQFATRLPTRAPADRLSFRLRRKLSRLIGGR